MSRGYRGIIFAIVGWLVLTGQQQQPKAQQSTEASQPAPRPIASPAPWRSYPDMKADACYQANDKDQADLCAQWRAALAAEESAAQASRATFWAVVASVLSAATVVGLIVTIWQTQGALGEARRGNRINLNFERRSRRESRESAAHQLAALEIATKNADAATKLADASDKSMRLQIRAYLYVKEIYVKLAYDGSVYACIVISNSGTTPAKLISASRKMICEKFGNIDPASTGPEPQRFSMFPSHLVPGQDFTMHVSVDNVDLNADFKTIEGMCLLVYGEVIYADVFGETQSLTFAYRQDSDLLGRQTQFCPCLKGNVAT